ncbi:unnamed protein product [Moneuplotes crassus]|uniref:Threonyl/alanyl tRNA synthetase SAD domain-containing protein n=1 Tax=Euplotes crassus TaxID=5936 RepID=A0AAD1XR41_EUPCR|nr:unnamed protein product [Moneuplotes crassus]
MESSPLSTFKQYETDSYLFESTGKVLQVNQLDSGKYEVIVDRTIFHPQGGGQPNDEGVIKSDDAEFTVEDIKLNGDYISHIGVFSEQGQTFEQDQEVSQVINEELRRKYARTHSAGHLIDMAMDKVGFGHLEPGKGYHFPKGAYVEYIGVVEADKRDQLKQDLNAAIKDIIDNMREEDSSVAKVHSYEEAKEVLGCIPPYLPEGKNVRIVKLCEDDKGCPCGGTHVKHIKDIEGIEVSKIQKKKKNTRVSYSVVDC